MSAAPESTFVQTVILTILVAFGYKIIHGIIRKYLFKATCVVIGAGPTGLISVIVASRTPYISRILLIEQNSYFNLINKHHQIAIQAENVKFLTSLGINFKKIDGIWQSDTFITMLGTFQEHLLGIIYRLQSKLKVDIRLCTKFNRETLKELDKIPARVIVIVCDGSRGQSARILRLSDEFSHHSCKAYGAVAALERTQETSVPTPETRVYNITFNLLAYENGCGEDSHPQGFHLKLFGSFRHRYMSLVIPRNSFKHIRTSTVFNDLMLRKIFQVCFNVYRDHNESYLCDKQAKRILKCSPGLFEIKYFQRMEPVGFIQESNMFVVTEGEAAMCLNFNSGQNINLAMKGLLSLERFLGLAASAVTEREIVEAINFKLNHAKAITQDYLGNGLKESMYL